MINFLFFIFLNFCNAENKVPNSIEPSVNMVLLDDSDSQYKLLFSTGITSVEYSIKPISNSDLNNYFWGKMHHQQTFLNLGIDFYFYRFLKNFEISSTVKYGGAGNNNFFVEGGLNLKYYLRNVKYLDPFYLKFGASYIHLKNVIEEGKTFYFNQAGMSSSFGFGTQVFTIGDLVLGIELEQKFLNSNSIKISSENISSYVTEYKDGAVSFTSIFCFLGWLL